MHVCASIVPLDEPYVAAPVVEWEKNTRSSSEMRFSCWDSHDDDDDRHDDDDDDEISSKRDGLDEHASEMMDASTRAGTHAEVDWTTTFDAT